MKTYAFGPTLLILFLLSYTTHIFAQNRETSRDTFHLNDSLQIQELSTQVQELTLQIQEMKLNEIALENEQKNKGKSDSIKKVLQKVQIDSLLLPLKASL